MKTKLVEDLIVRIETEITDRSSLAYLRKLDVDDYIDIVISVVYLYTRARRGRNTHTTYLTEVVAAIGHGIRNRFRMKKNSATAARTGAFMLYTFEELGIVEVLLGHGARGHAAYIVRVVNDDALSELWDSLEPGEIEKLPSERPYAPWTSHRHETGAFLVKTGNKDVLDSLQPDTHPIVFDCVNKAQRMGWTVNQPVYDLHVWALKNKTEAFRGVWEMHNQEARATKMREVRAIGDIAKKFLGKTFYHLYYYDFRGRKYPATAYLHEQGNDLARGMLLSAESKEIGEEGFFWMMVAAANHWAGECGRDDGAKTDKIPLKERYAWAVDNEEILLSYAESPKVNQGWMRADKPWQFIAVCMELKKLREWQYEHGSGDDPYGDYGYSSSLFCHIDGSNNGSQHLSALTKDEVTAPHVNLVPLPLPGDLYGYVADSVWRRIEAQLSELSREERDDCERFIDTLIDMKKRINEAEPKSDRRKELISQVQSFKDRNRELLEMSAPVFWARVTDNKHRRKIVKRNVMTLPYGGTAYGLGEQQISDARKHNIELLLHLEHKWGAYMGREIFADCRVSLRRPMRLLTVFETAGRKAEAEGRFLSWTVPMTHFPVVQNYTEGVVKKIWVQYGPPSGPKGSTGHYPNELQLAVSFVEDVRPSRGKQAQGASPNAIHSLDAAHLALTVHRADFPVCTIHDSFGCLLADMPKLYELIRETFVELYSVDPLGAIMGDIGGDLSEVELGDLDVSLVMQSEYCFA